MLSLAKRGFKWPKKEQWLRFFRVLDRKEKKLFFFFLGLLFVSFFFLIFNFYFKNTAVLPARGGTYKEGLVGQPRFINPLYATSDVDRDIVELVYSGLMKYNNKGEIVFDLAEKYELKEDKTVYEVTLKENIFWHDGNLLTADDVVFTVETIQNPGYKSPFRANWLGVAVEKINDFKIRFSLRDPYAGFLENLTLKIIPKHIWSEISPENAPLSSYNFKPIGSGFYQVSEVNQRNDNIESLILERKKDAFISKIEFVFFEKKDEISRVDGFGSLKEEKRGWNSYNIDMPRYFSLFFNLEKIDFDKDIRKALNYAVDKESLLGVPISSPFFFENGNDYNPEKARKILKEKGFSLNEEGYKERAVEKNVFTENLKIGSRGDQVRELQSCLSNFEGIYSEEITGYFGPKTEQAVILFQEMYYQDILEPSNLTKGNGLVRAGTRAKLDEVCFQGGEILEFSLATLDQENLLETAKELKNQFEKLGIKVNIEKIQEEEIKNREYQSFLIGIVSSAILDPLPFWHSEQKKDPGYNFSLYENKKADDLLESLRVTFEEELRKEKLRQLEELIVEDMPALFLYTKGYYYNVSDRVKGIELEKIINPSHRFSGIDSWYIRVKRQWK